MQKKFFVLTGLLFLILFLSGCSDNLTLDNKPTTLEFKSDLSIKFKEMELSANIIRTEDHSVSITVTAPETLNGLKIERNNSQSSISKGELIFKTDNIILPNSSVLKSIIDILDYIANNPEEEPYYSDSKEIDFIGKINDEKFEIKVNKNIGFVKEIKIGEKVDVNFFNQEKL